MSSARSATRPWCSYGLLADDRPLLGRRLVHAGERLCHANQYGTAPRQRRAARAPATSSSHMTGEQRDGPKVSRIPRATAPRLRGGSRCPRPSRRPGSDEQRHAVAEKSPAGGARIERSPQLVVRHGRAERVRRERARSGGRRPTGRRRSTARDRCRRRGRAVVGAGAGILVAEVAREIEVLGPELYRARALARIASRAARAEGSPRNRSTRRGRGPLRRRPRARCRAGTPSRACTARSVRRAARRRTARRRPAS